jgi:hypothetical protein
MKFNSIQEGLTPSETSSSVGNSNPPPESPSQRALASPPRARAFLFGLALVPFLCGWGIRAEIITGGAELIEASLLPLAVFVLFGLTLCNHLVRRRWPELALSQAELLIVYVMQTTSVGIAGLGQMQFLSQALAGAYGFSTPENHWEVFHPMIPRWWVPDPDVLGDFYRGDSTLFTADHLRGWAVPVLVWCGFLGVMLFCFLCLNTLLRKPWITYERLTFPLAVLPFELTREESARSILRNREFWLAIGVVFLFRSSVTLNRLIPGFPEIGHYAPEGQGIDLGEILTTAPWSAVGYFRMTFHPLVIGLTYFLPLDIAFSASFFYLLSKGEDVLATALGFRGAGAGPAAQRIPYTGEQGAGAFLALALLTLWNARPHLRAVFRKAFRGDPAVRDDEEPLPYRTAVFGFLASSAALVAFATAGGLAFRYSLLFFALYLVMIVTVTRLRAEAGPMIHYGPDFNPHQILTALPGTRAWDARSLTTFSYLQWFDSDYRTVAMPQQMEALKIAEMARFSARRLAKWMMAAVFFASVTAFLTLLALYYHYGADTPRGDNGWRSYNGRLPFELLMNWLGNRSDPAALARAAAMGVGFGVTAALVKARMSFAGWPFHAAGYVMANAGLTMTWTWFPVLVGWLLKGAILRWGGMKGYRRFLPVFLGLILGDFVSIGVWSLIGVAMDLQMYMFFPG